MLHSRFRLDDKGEVALATAINSKRQMKIVALVVVTIAVVAIALFSLGGCGGTGAASDSSANESEESTASDDVTFSVEVTIKPSVNDYTWDELSQISEEIGDTASEDAAMEIAKSYNLVGPDGKLDGSQAKSITLSDGTATEVQIAGFLHDEKTGGGKAGITFIFKDVIAKHDMKAPTGNVSGRNTGGWEGSQVRSWLASSGLAMLPQDLSSKVVAVDKKTNNVGETEDVSSVTTTSDKLWLFSFVELVGSAQNNVLAAEGSEYKLFKDCNVVSKGRNSILSKSSTGASEWWERSPDPESEVAFYDVDYYGGPDHSYPASNSIGVVPGFCI